MVTRLKIGPGLHAPARFFCAALIGAALMIPAAADAQLRERRQGGQRAAQSPARTAPQPQLSAPASVIASLPVPEGIVVSKLLWSTMAALDQASDTGNFSVLRDLGSAAFRQKHNPQTLAQIFVPLRDKRVDLADTLLFSPTYELAPHMVTPTAFRMRGSFPMRPTAVAFDLIYSWEGSWRLDAVAVLPIASVGGR
jgi:hypothetical protein